MQSSWRLCLPLVVSLLLLTRAAIASPAGPDVLNDTSWTLSVLPGQSLIAGRAATVHFTDGRMHGNDGCNSFGSSYAVVGDRLRIDGRLLSTRMACPAAIMRQADVFTSVLARASTFRSDAGRLVLLAGDGEELAILDAQRRDLAGTGWRVTAYNNGKRAVVSVLDVQF
ncbi:MAG TPA: META domain-containing protein [Accumulibacter sp.]|nr:META domain-containing protein [Accumulibacter sp.]